jgi:hypothetical protein
MNKTTADADIFTFNNFAKSPDLYRRPGAA